MAKISQYTDAVAPQTSDLFIIARAGQNFRLLWSAIKAGMTGTNGESVLASAFGLTAGAGTYQDTGLAITLPSAGTYLLLANIATVLAPNTGTSWFISAKLYNSTDAADVANSERICILTYTAASIQETMAALSMPITVTASKVIKLYAKRDGTGTPTFTASSIYSDANGRTNLAYVKLS
jgi:hypothetical protein